MKVRAKFIVTKVSTFGCEGMQSNIIVPDPSNVPGSVQKWLNSGIPRREITLTAQYNPAKNPEGIGFSTSTPTGSITFELNNPDLAQAFQPGTAYYVDFTPIG